MIMDIFETKSFAATFTGLTTLGVSYLANVPDWALLVLPLSVVAGYWFIHRREAAAGADLSHNHGTACLGAGSEPVELPGCV